MNWYNTIFLFITIHLSFEDYTYNVQHIKVPLDHFSFSNTIKFKLRYLINATYWSSNGPILFYTGNEGDINIFAQNTGFMWEIASEFQALLVFAEHRYYGESLPFGNLSFSAPEYVGYLTSSQALADFVYLIDFLQKSNNYKEEMARSPVIAIGGSYGGMLAAWLRMKYPASVLGAISSSAPIWQFSNLIPCDIFNRITTSVYKTASISFDCSKVISSSWPILQAITASEEGRNWLTENWKLCKPIQTEDDINTLLEWLQDIYSNMAMINYPYPTNFIADIPAYPIKTFCSKLQFTFKDPHQFIKQLGIALSVYINNTGTIECVDVFSQSTKMGELGWNFQSCTEIVMPMCSKSADMFISEAWNFTKFAQDCFNKWKIKPTSETLPILEYGGKQLQSASNIIFSNGLLDPWSGGGVLKNISKTVIAYLIPDAAHHLDLRSSHPLDPPSIIAARNFYKSIIKRWLKAFYIDYFNEYYN